MNKIVKLEQHIFFDLSGNPVCHLCFWRVFYSSGSQRTIKTASPYSLSSLPKTVIPFYMSAAISHSYILQMTESGIERVFVYKLK